MVIVALSLGLWAGIFASAFVKGMMDQKIESVINLEVSHFQIHQKGFRDEFLVKQFINNGYEIRAELLQEPMVKEVAARTINMMMISTARGTSGVKVSGISPAEEKIVTRLHEKIVEGKYLDISKNNSILISSETAKKYKIALKSKLVLTCQDVNGEIAAAAFRVAGIYSSGNKMFDAANVFVKREDIQQFLGIGNGVHEIAVLLKEHSQAEAMALKYRHKFPQLEVLSWMDLSSGMRYIIGFMDKYTTIIVGIILLALLFSIINTMLMSVLERVNELGMLMAVGMNKKKVFSMIMLETLFISMVGGPIGLLFAWISVSYFGSKGLNLGNAAYEDLGFSNLIFPSLEAIEYLKVTIMVIIMALIAAVYPARKALKLNPVETIRKT